MADLSFTPQQEQTAKIFADLVDARYGEYRDLALMGMPEEMNEIARVAENMYDKGYRPPGSKS